MKTRRRRSTAHVEQPFELEDELQTTVDGDSERGVVAEVDAKHLPARSWRAYECVAATHGPGRGVAPLQRAS
jgi:hypothetical protein